MNHERLQGDDGLAAALRGVTADPMQQQVDWEALVRTIGGRASPELARRRWRRRVMRVGLPSALAASIAFLLLWVAPPAPTGPGSGALASAGLPSASITVDELLDAGVSEGQFRALLYGAAEADALLLIAAAEDERQ